MSDPSMPWDPARVRNWLERRVAASKQDQAAADRRGYEARDDYDKAAAEEWVCRTLQAADCIDDQAAFARRLKELIAQEDYRVTGIHDDVRFQRHVRGQLRKVAQMAKANAGFDNLLRFQ